LYRDARRNLRLKQLIRSAQRNKEPAPTHERPLTRGECIDMPRPCPFVGCRYHLFLEVTNTGGITLPWGEDPEAIKDLKHTCALDVAEGDGIERNELAAIFNLSSYGVTNVYNSALAKLGMRQTMVDSGPPDAEAQHKAGKIQPGNRYGPDRFGSRRRGADAFAAEPPD
jgi:hypothetical protein